MLKIFSIAAILFVTVSCSDKRQGDEKAIQIVEQSIEAHGGKNYRDMDVSFDFRQFRVHLKQKEGAFLYERTSRDSLNNEIQDILTNDSFTREVNGKKHDLSQKETDKYKEGLNAIAYFALLPYKLSEPAVKLNTLARLLSKIKSMIKFVFHLSRPVVEKTTRTNSVTGLTTTLTQWIFYLTQVADPDLERQ